MRTPLTRLKSLNRLAVLAGFCLIAGAATAQGNRTDFTFSSDDTSDNNRVLKRLFERFPEADTNNDGVLGAEEGRTLVRKLNEEAARRRAGRNGRLVPDEIDVQYGPHKKHVLDLYLAKTEEPAPLVIYFHGGQFITGDEDDTGTLNVGALLSAGISVASVDYRETHLDPFPAPFQDAAQAVQYLRLMAENFNLDPERFAGHGDDAGGNLALYLALHDDLAIPEDELDLPEDSDPDAEADEDRDPPARRSVPADGTDTDTENETAEEEEDETPPWERPEIATMSTRLVCAAVMHPIASFDPRIWAEHRLPMNDHERLMTKYLGVRYLDPLDDEEVIALVEDVSPLALVSPDDPELLMMSQYQDLDLTDDLVWTIMQRHPKQAKLIASAMRAKGNKATVRYRGMKDDPRIGSVDFFINKLKN